MREVFGNDNSGTPAREPSEFSPLAVMLSRPPSPQTELPRTKSAAREMDGASQAILGSLIVGVIAFALWRLTQPLGPTPPTQGEVKLLEMLQPQISENVRIIRCQHHSCEIKLSGEELVRYRRQTNDYAQYDYGTGIAGFTYVATPKDGKVERTFRVDNLNMEQVPATRAYQHLLADIQAATNYALTQQTNRHKSEEAAKRNRASYEN